MRTLHRKVNCISSVIIIIADKMLRLNGGKKRVFHLIKYVFEITIMFL